MPQRFLNHLRMYTFTEEQGSAPGGVIVMVNTPIPPLRSTAFFLQIRC
jgi:hypothetical protein